MLCLLVLLGASQHLLCAGTCERRREREYRGPLHAHCLALTQDIRLLQETIHVLSALGQFPVFRLGNHGGIAENIALRPHGCKICRSAVRGCRVFSSGCVPGPSSSAGSHAVARTTHSAAAVFSATCSGARCVARPPRSIVGGGRTLRQMPRCLFLCMPWLYLVV